MDKREAQGILDDFVAALQSHFTYPDWQKLVGEGDVVERQGASGAAYQIEWNVFWDAKSGGAIRVMVSIDDGTLIRSLVPLTTSLLISPEGELV